MLLKKDMEIMVLFYFKMALLLELEDLISVHFFCPFFLFS